MPRHIATLLALTLTLTPHLALALEPPQDVEPPPPLTRQAEIGIQAAAGVASALGGALLSLPLVLAFGGRCGIQSCSPQEQRRSDIGTALSLGSFIAIGSTTGIGLVGKFNRTSQPKAWAATLLGATLGISAGLATLSSGAINNLPDSPRLFTGIALLSLTPTLGGVLGYQLTSRWPEHNRRRSLPTHSLNVHIAPTPQGTFTSLSFTF